MEKEKNLLRFECPGNGGGRKPGSAHVSIKNYLLIDEEGTQVQALTSEYSLISLFAKQMKVGSVYMVSKYGVEDAPEIYRPVPGKFIIKLYRKTKVTDPGNIPTIPRYGWQAHKVYSYTNYRNGKKTLDIVLKDERNDSMKIVLWENQSYDFLHYKTDCEKPNVFLLVTGTTSKLVKDIVPIIKSHAQSTVEDIERVEIQQLFDAQLPEGKNAIAFTIEATILELIPNYGGWCYMGCKSNYCLPLELHTYHCLSLLHAASVPTKDSSASVIHLKLLCSKLSKNFNETIDDDKLKEFDVRSGVIQLVLAEDLDLDPNGKMISSKPLYIALAQSKVERRARLQAQFSQMRPVAMVPHMPKYPRGAPGTG
ncbi:hypothetical protein POM88_000182 [Heracleum sosnowskyi]|uniref:Uncharacterized protein n=1 Tax=Heracleum sosnowskyi TaxID=360622 RepID=A0AAD8N937_9APIA|nr:hypothetical protein POM88_000182 [Heracleum sosnowskyi]